MTFSKTIFDDLGNIIPEKQYLNNVYIFTREYLWSTEIHQTWQP